VNPLHALEMARKAIKETAEAAARMRRAQRNAAKAISEGGLGLRPDNTPMERAKAMGYEGGWYHGTGADFESFDKGSQAGMTPTNTYDAEMAHFLTNNPEVAAEYATEAAKNRNWQTFAEYEAATPEVKRQVGALLDAAGITNRDQFRTFLERLHHHGPNSDIGRQVADLLEIRPARPVVMPLMARGDYAAKDYGGEPWGEWLTYDALRQAQDEGRAGLRMENVGDSLSGEHTGTSLAVFDPQNIRSVNAAFDPAKRNSPNLLYGVGAPIGISGIMGLTPEEETEALRLLEAGRWTQ